MRGNSSPTFVTIVSLKFLAVLIGGGILAIVKNTSWLSAIKPLGINPDQFCIYDWGHDILAPWNRIIVQYTSYQYIAEILSSFMIDGAFIHSLAVWVIEAKTARLLHALLMFYGLRASIQVRVANLRESLPSRSLQDRLGTLQSSRASWSRTVSCPISISADTQASWSSISARGGFKTRTNASSQFTHVFWPTSWWS